MKKHYLLIVVFNLLLSCQNQGYDYALEEEILQCFYEEHGDKGVEFKNSLEKLESMLVTNNLLKGRSDENYIDFIAEVAESGLNELYQKPFAKDTASLAPFPVGIGVSIRCNKLSLNNIDTLAISNSRLKGISQVFDDIIGEGISPENIASSILKSYSAEDFEHEYYRSSLLMLLYIELELYSISEASKIVQLPSWSDEEPDITKLKPENVLKVKVTRKQEIEINGVKVKLDEINQLARDFLLSEANESIVDLPGYETEIGTGKAIISLTNEKGTSYKIYLAVYNHLKKAYEELWEERSQLLFDEKFSNLTGDKVRIIKRIIPFVISEAEPTSFKEGN